jgi:hypothetical protein
VARAVHVQILDVDDGRQTRATTTPTTTKDRACARAREEFRFVSFRFVRVDRPVSESRCCVSCFIHSSSTLGF